MPKFEESTIVAASQEELWAMLPDLPVIGNEFMGVQKIELQPAGQPFGVDSRLHVTMSTLSRVVVARIVDIDDEAFSFHSELSGSGISGETTTQVHAIDSEQSRLAITGDIRGNILTGAFVALGLTVFKHEGVLQIGKTLSRHARARREST